MFDTISIRNISEEDCAVLHYLAESCKPLDVHTHYTYWVISKFFSSGSFLLFCNNEPIGYITSIETDKVIFIWQIGILEQYRSLGYSKTLISAISNYARKKKKNLAVSIAKENERSFCAFQSFSKINSYRFTKSGKLCLHDLSNTSFVEEENIYSIIINDEWNN